MQRGGTGRLRLRDRIDTHWPLVLLFYLFPLWWVLGLAQIMVFVPALVMLWKLMSRQSLRLPQGFGVHLLFLCWVLLGASMLWVSPEGTATRSGLSPLMGFSFRFLWWLSITVICVYIVNSSRRQLSVTRVTRMLSYLFVVTVLGGILGLVAPTLDFPSAIELVLPRSITDQPFMNAMFHPRISLQQDILGYEETRITAPYPYPNTWGNAYGLLLPVFVYAWFGKDAGWRRRVAPLVLAISIVPAVFSLNRGLWLGVGIAIVWVAIRRLLAADLRAFVGILAGVASLGLMLVATPLGTMIALRLANPHSDDRRMDTATLVLRTAWESSPILGFGGTRDMVGNFTSLAGGGSAACHQCAAPPLGTQGFLWGLVFMTGFVGAALFIGFLVWHFQLNARRPDALALMTSTILLCTVFYFLFYDSLGMPLLVTMMAIGLSAREHAPPLMEELDV